MHLLEFVRSRKFGFLELGMSRLDVVKHLGPPVSWVGKPPTIGPQILIPEEADVWLYYGNGASIKFDESGHSISVGLVPKHINKELPIFRSFPIGPGATMSDFRNFLVEQEISFSEGKDPEAYYILAHRQCLALSFPYWKGKLIPKGDQEIGLISTVTNQKDLPSFVDPD